MLYWIWPEKLIDRNRELKFNDSFDDHVGKNLLDCTAGNIYLENVVAEIPTFDIKEPFVGFEKNGEIYLWLTTRLWELSKDYPVFEYEVSSFNSFDKDVWFNSQHKPTVNKVLEHYKKIEKAHFTHPIILSQDGIVLGGVHRICRAYLDGRKTIPAIRFEVDPEPDRKHPVS